MATASDNAAIQARAAAGASANAADGTAAAAPAATSSNAPPSATGDHTNPAKKNVATVVHRLNRISNIASILCAIDCTVFPLLLTVLPLISAVSTRGAIDWLHKVSHVCALRFVGPVGGLAVVANWVQHKRALVGLWGLSGIMLIVLANIHLPHTILRRSVPHSFSNFLHARHSIVNVLGCLLLLSSQRYAHSLNCCCDHSHGHGREHRH